MDRYVQDLTEQVGFLLKSGRLFDAGDLPEGKRLAACIRTLVHQTDTSHALLVQCGVSNTMTFGDSACPIDPTNMLSSHALTAKSTDGSGWRYAPSRRPIHRWVPFDDWWRATVIHVPPPETPAPSRVAAQAATTFSRKYLVLELANTDGGTHVGQFKKKYEDLSRKNLLGWTGRRGDETYSLGNPALVSVRQITYEVLASIEREFPGLVRGHKDNRREAS